MTGEAPLERPIAADWLGLRRAPDEAAREAAGGLLARLAAAYDGPGADDNAGRARGSLDGRGRSTESGAHGIAVIDVGAGTGANRAYLQPRLPFPTTWTLLDHDPALLADGGNTGCRRVLGGIETIPALLAELAPRPRLVTCSALLDLLSAAELDALVAAVLDAGVPALFALTVTGGVRIDPADEADALVGQAFDAHQARAGRPGPGAASYVERAARAAGAAVHRATTPWRVGAQDAGAVAFLGRYLTDRADAAAEHAAEHARRHCPGGGSDAARVAGWLSRRLAALDAGDLRLVVDHVDLLVLPGPTGLATRSARR